MLWREDRLSANTASAALRSRLAGDGLRLEDRVDAIALFRFQRTVATVAVQHSDHPIPAGRPSCRLA